MKHPLAIAVLLAASIAYADDLPTSSTTSETSAIDDGRVDDSMLDDKHDGDGGADNLDVGDAPLDEPGAPGENAAPKKSTAEAAKVHGRFSTPTPRTPRPRIKDDGESRLEKTEDEVAGGRHWRIKTAQGAVHVWVPPNYDRATAGTVVYVHGYWTDADGAWRDHSLARQFKASRQNALFIVPDAPSSNEARVKWPALMDLRRAVTRGNIKLPDGPIVVMGHSGAFRTVMQWVDHRHVDQIILLDAMYAGEHAFDDFIHDGKRASDHKLIVVAAGTATESKAFAKKYKFAVAREKFPDSVGGFTKREKSAKLLYIRSQFGHMEIVTNKKVIPTLLRLTPLKAL
ncbi:MAG: hypothetical protein ACKV2T_07545 [Kofleriaceae bacterium]